MTEDEIKRLRAYLLGHRPHGEDKAVGDIVLRAVGRNMPGGDGMVAKAAQAALLLWGQPPFEASEFARKVEAARAQLHIARHPPVRIVASE